MVAHSKIVVVGGNWLPEHSVDFGVESGVGQAEKDLQPFVELEERRAD